MEFTEPNKDHLRTLKRHFKLKEFKKAQWEVIRGVMYEKRDCCVIASTGFGKSLIYQFPPVFMGKLTVVISPLCALMQDQVLSLQSRGIKAVFFGSQQKDKSLRMNDFNIAYITPEFLFGNGKLLLREAKHKVMMFAVDEAHVLDQWSDFRSVYSRLGSIRENFPKIPIVALTATAPQYVQDIITNTLQLREDFVFVKTALDRPNLEFSVIRKRGGHRNYFKDVMPLLKKLKEGSAIVYCLSRALTEEISLDFNLEGIDCRPYHSKLSIEYRKKVVQDFRDSKLRFVICTIAYGMGIDKGDVRLVVHYGISKSMEAYYQEAGRAGRDGKPSRCILFYGNNDYKILFGFIQDNKKANKDKQKHLLKLLDRMVEFVTSNLCRRLEMLNYLGTTEEELKKITIRKSCCDNCRKDLLHNIPPQLQYQGVSDDGTHDFSNDARILLETIENHSNCDETLEVLEILQADNKPKDWWERMISLLVQNEFILVDDNKFKLVEKAKNFLQSQQPQLLLKVPQDMFNYFKARNDIELFWNDGDVASRSKIELNSASQVSSDDLFRDCEDFNVEDLLAVCDKEELSGTLNCDTSTDNLWSDEEESENSQELLKEIDNLEQQDSKEQLEISSLDFISFDVDDDEQESLGECSNKRQCDNYEQNMKKVKFE